MILSLNASKKIIFLFLLLFPPGLFAQRGILTGNVFDNKKRSVILRGARVLNLETKKLVFTNQEGHYAIAAKKGDLISISYVGYKTDTIYLTNLLIKNVYLTPDTISLKGVAITGVKISSYLNNLGNPDNKAPARLEEMDKSRGGIRLNLGYGKYRRNQAKVQKLEEEERYQQEISDNFNENFVKSLIKFEGTKEDFDYFMAMYRPMVEEVKAQRPFNYELYTAEAYNRWKALPPEKRKLPPLPKIKANN